MSSAPQRCRSYRDAGADQDRVAGDTVSRCVISDSRCPQGHAEAKQTISNPEDSCDPQRPACQHHMPRSILHPLSIRHSRHVVLRHAPFDFVEHLHPAPDERAVLPRHRLEGARNQPPMKRIRGPELLAIYSIQTQLVSCRIQRTNGMNATITPARTAASSTTRIES